MRTEQDLSYQTYMLRLHGVLSDFQFIEEGLRFYIGAAYSLIRSRVSDTIPFELDESSLEKDSLGKLVAKFSSLTADKDLVKELQALAPFRNQAAHKGFLEMAASRHDIAALDRGAREFEGIKARTSACFEKIRLAVGKLDSVDARDA